MEFNIENAKLCIIWNSNNNFKCYIYSFYMDNKELATKLIES